MAGSIELSFVEAAVDLIKQLGFPVFVAGWFMLRVESRLDTISEELRRLKK